MALAINQFRAGGDEFSHWTVHLPMFKESSWICTKIAHEQQVKLFLGTGKSVLADGLCSSPVNTYRNRLWRTKQRAEKTERAWREMRGGLHGSQRHRLLRFVRKFGDCHFCQSLKKTLVFSSR